MSLKKEVWILLILVGLPMAFADINIYQPNGTTNAWHINESTSSTSNLGITPINSFLPFNPTSSITQTDYNNLRTIDGSRFGLSIVANRQKYYLSNKSITEYLSPDKSISQLLYNISIDTTVSSNAWAAYMWNFTGSKWQLCTPITNQTTELNNVSCVFTTGLADVINAQGINYLMIWGDSVASSTMRTDRLQLEVTFSRMNSSNYVTNTSTPRYNQPIRFNTTFNTPGDLHSYIFTHNLSGVFQNSSPSTSWSIGTPTNISTNVSVINLTRGSIIGWGFYANDTQGKINFTGINTVTVANTPPTTTNPTINNSAKTNDILTCTVGGLSDVDGDSLSTSYYRWYRNGSLISGQTVSTLNLATAGNGDKSDNINCEWLGNDGVDNSSSGFLGSPNLTIGNTDPTTPTILSPLNNLFYNTANLLVTTSDIDSDNLNFWFYINSSIPNSSTTNFTNYNNNDGNYSLKVHVDDGISNSSNSSTIYFYLENTAPSFSGIVDNSTASTPKKGNDVHLNFTLRDSPAGISHYRVATNQTGSFVNQTLRIGSGNTQTASETVTITMNKGILGWQIWTNDTAKNINTSTIQTLQVINTPPPQVTSFTNPSNNPSYVKTNITFQWVAVTDTDSDTVYYAFYENSTLKQNSTSISYNSQFTNSGNRTYYIVSHDGEENGASSEVRSIFFDDVPPTWSNNHTNATASTPKTKQYIQLNVTISDNLGVSNYRLAHNMSGVMTNLSTQSTSGTNTIISQSVEVTSVKGALKWQYWFNDTVGNTNITDEFVTVIHNTLPVSNTTTITAPATDQDNLTGNSVYSDYDNNVQFSNETRWYNNYILLAEFNNLFFIGSENTSINDKWIFSIRFNDGESWGEWYNSSPVTIGDGDAPVLSAATVSPSTIETNNRIQFYINITDANSSVNYIKAELEDPDGLKTNISMVLFTGINLPDQNQKWNVNSTPIKVGTWYAKFYAQDDSGNGINTSARYISFTVTAAATPATPAGGGTETIIINASQKPACNYDGMCTSTENFDNCRCLKFSQEECGVEKLGVGDCRPELRNLGAGGNLFLQILLGIVVLAVILGVMSTTNTFSGLFKKKKSFQIVGRK